MLNLPTDAFQIDWCRGKKVGVLDVGSLAVKQGFASCDPNVVVKVERILHRLVLVPLNNLLTHPGADAA